MRPNTGFTVPYPAVRLGEETFSGRIPRKGGRRKGRVINDVDLRRVAARIDADQKFPTDELAAEGLHVSADTVRRARDRRPWREFLPVSAVE